MIRLIESIITRRRLDRAHANAIGVHRREQGPRWAMTRPDRSNASTGHTEPFTKTLNTVQGTSPTSTPETEPHQPRVGTGKSPVPRDGIETWRRK